MPFFIFTCYNRENKTLRKGGKRLDLVRWDEFFFRAFYDSKETFFVLLSSGSLSFELLILGNEI